MRNDNKTYIYIYILPVWSLIIVLHSFQMFYSQSFNYRTVSIVVDKQTYTYIYTYTDYWYAVINIFHPDYVFLNG